MNGTLQTTSANKKANHTRSSVKDEHLNDILGVLHEVSAITGARRYIFRGEPQCYDDVSSTLYRELQDLGFDLAKTNMEIAQRAILEQARSFTNQADDIELLSELQHYGGKTNFIDFTTDYLIALFFACDGFPESDGRLLLLERTDERNHYIYEARTPSNRILAQKSVFVRPPTGVVQPDHTIIIPRRLKQPLQQHLKRLHGISTETIYNDLMGFIRHHDLHHNFFAELVAGLGAETKEEAIEHFDKAIALNPQAVGAYRSRGNVQRDSEDLEGTKAYVYGVRGIAHAEGWELDRAIQDYNKALELDPDDASVYRSRGLAFIQKGVLDRARRDLDKAIELSPGYATAYNDRAGTFGTDVESAVQDYSKAIQLDPNNSIYYMNRGNAYSKRSEFSKALLDFNRALEIDPYEALAYFGRAGVYSDMDEYDSVINDLDKAVDLDPTFPISYKNRGRAYFLSGQFDEAIADYGKTIEMDPKDSDAYVGRGTAHARRGEYRLALKDYTEALVIAPDNYMAYLDRGIVYFTIEEYQLAIEDFNDTIALNPRMSEAYGHRGAAYGEIGDLEQAIHDLDKAVDADPVNSSLLRDRGIAYSKKGEFNRALQDYDQALSLDPNNAGAYYSRGKARHRFSDFQGSIEDHNSCIALDPSFLQAYVERGIAWLSLGDNQRAFEDLSKAKNEGLDVKSCLHSEFEGLDEFGERYGVRVSQGIKALLENSGQQDSTSSPNTETAD